MRKYRVFVNGQNFLLGSEDKKKLEKYGFYTTRYVEANEPKEAKRIALDLILKEFEEIIRNEAPDSPILDAEEINEINSFGDNIVPGKGATWYLEESET